MEPIPGNRNDPLAAPSPAATSVEEKIAAVAAKAIPLLSAEAERGDLARKQIRDLMGEDFALYQEVKGWVAAYPDKTLSELLALPGEEVIALKEELVERYLQIMREVVCEQLKGVMGSDYKTYKELLPYSEGYIRHATTKKGIEECRVANVMCYVEKKLLEAFGADALDMNFEAMDFVTFKEESVCKKTLSEQMMAFWDCTTWEEIVALKDQLFALEKLYQCNAARKPVLMMFGSAYELYKNETGWSQEFPEKTLEECMEEYYALTDVKSIEMLYKEIVDTYNRKRATREGR